MANDTVARALAIGALNGGGGGGGSVAIDNQTIVKEDNKLKTAVGGYKETVTVSLSGFTLKRRGGPSNDYETSYDGWTMTGIDTAAPYFFSQISTGVQYPVTIEWVMDEGYSEPEYESVYLEFNNKDETSVGIGEYALHWNWTSSSISQSEFYIRGADNGNDPLMAHCYWSNGVGNLPYVKEFTIKFDTIQPTTADIEVIHYIDSSCINFTEDFPLKKRKYSWEPDFVNVSGLVYDTNTSEGGADIKPGFRINITSTTSPAQLYSDSNGLFIAFNYKHEQFYLKDSPYGAMALHSVLDGGYNFEMIRDSKNVQFTRTNNEIVIDNNYINKDVWFALFDELIESGADNATGTQYMNVHYGIANNPDYISNTAYFSGYIHSGTTVGTVKTFYFNIDDITNPPSDKDYIVMYLDTADNSVVCKFYVSDFWTGQQIYFFEMTNSDSEAKAYAPVSPKFVPIDKETIVADGDVIKSVIPAAPSVAGTYTLQCVVDASGNKTYSWI